MVSGVESHMTTAGEFGFHRECQIEKCKNNLNGSCKLRAIILKNDICMNNTLLNDDSKVEIRLFNHRNNKVHYQKLSKLQLYLIDRILRNENGGI